MLAALIDGMTESGEGGTGARGVRRDATGDGRGNRNGTNMASVLSIMEMCWGDVAPAAVDAAPGPRQRRDRVGRQRRAAGALRQAVGVDGDHRAGLRLGLRQHHDHRRARRRRLRPQRREDLRHRRRALRRRRGLGDARQVEGPRRDQVVRRPEGHARA